MNATDLSGCVALTHRSLKCWALMMEQTQQPETVQMRTKLTSWHWPLEQKCRSIQLFAGDECDHCEDL